MRKATHSQCRNSPIFKFYVLESIHECKNCWLLTLAPWGTFPRNILLLQRFLSKALVSVLDKFQHFSPVPRSFKQLSKNGILASPTRGKETSAASWTGKCDLSQTVRWPVVCTRDNTATSWWAISWHTPCEKCDRKASIQPRFLSCHPSKYYMRHLQRSELQ